MATAKRKDGESFDDYRLRLKNQSLFDKVQLMGKIIWESTLRGTYIKVKHGPIGGGSSNEQL